jgi:hypothetical protein
MHAPPPWRITKIGCLESLVVVKPPVINPLKLYQHSAKSRSIPIRLFARSHRAIIGYCFRSREGRRYANRSLRHSQCLASIVNSLLPIGNRKCFLQFDRRVILPLHHFVFACHLTKKSNGYSHCGRNLNRNLIIIFMPSLYLRWVSSRLISTSVHVFIKWIVFTRPYSFKCIEKNHFTLASPHFLGSINEPIILRCIF